MSHQPFETWILDHGSLSLEERRKLQEHIATCAQCQRLEQKWSSVYQELRTRRMVAPSPGFAQRWQTGLAERRAREQRKQAWKIFGILLGSALFVLTILAGYLLVSTTPANWLVAVVRMLSSSQVMLEMIFYGFQLWLSSTPLALNLALWIYLTVTLCFLLLVWLLVLWRTKSVGVLNS